MLKTWLYGLTAKSKDDRKEGYGNFQSPPYLPLRRQRALTPPNSAESRYPNPQIQSSFMNLPIEVRLLIYEFSFGNRTIHLDFEFRHEYWHTKEGTLVVNKKSQKRWRWWNYVCDRLEWWEPGTDHSAPWLSG
jgi:hypothetical protein